MLRWHCPCWLMPLAAGFSLLAGCGGSEAPTPATPPRFGLQLTAPSAVAGLQWDMALSPTAAHQADMSRRAEVALGPDARVMSRSNDRASTLPAVEWLIYAKASPGSTGWMLLEVDAVNIADLPPIQTVICANAYGNSVPCTLRWAAL